MSYSVLIVDDSFLIRKIIRNLPVWGTDTGFIIAGEAENSQEAMAFLDSRTYDLVITDICMPGLDGLDLLDKIKREKLATCVVLLSDHAEFSYARKGILYGAFDYLLKPVTEDVFSDLLQRVRIYLDKKVFGQSALQSGSRALKWKDIISGGEYQGLLRSLRQGQTVAIEQAHVLARYVQLALDMNVVKTRAVLYTVGEQLNAQLLADFPWLTKYADLKGRLNECLAVGAMTDILQSFADFIQNLLDIIAAFTPRQFADERVRKIAGYMLEHIDAQLSLKMVAEELYINRTHMCDVFKAKAGLTAGAYLQFLKIAHAEYLLKNTAISLEDITECLGYKSKEYFSRVFKQQTGILPEACRRSASSC